MGAKKSLNREAIGKRIGQVRMKAGLTHIEFAKSLHTSALVTDIAEHGIRYADGAIFGSINISPKHFVHLLESISKVYNVPLDWLKYGDGMTFEIDNSVCPNDKELTLYLPVTICGRSLVEEMNDALSLMSMNLCKPSESIAIQQNLMAAIVHKYHLYKQYAKLSGNTQHADTAHNKMMDALYRTLCPR